MGAHVRSQGCSAAHADAIMYVNDRCRAKAQSALSSSSSAREKAPLTWGTSEDGPRAKERTTLHYGAPTTYQVTGSQVRGSIFCICRLCPHFPDEDTGTPGQTEVIPSTLNSEEAAGAWGSAQTGRPGCRSTVRTNGSFSLNSFAFPAAPKPTWCEQEGRSRGGSPARARRTQGFVSRYRLGKHKPPRASVEGNPEQMSASESTSP